MARAHAAMTMAVAASSCADPIEEGGADPETADELEYAFNRLFVGPGPVTAPPYASIYLDPDSRLMDTATRVATAVYDALGFSSFLADSLPDDHLAVELDAVLAFRELDARVPSVELAALWQYFLHDHLVSWIPLFASRIMQAHDVPPAVSHAVDVLAAWLSDAAGIKNLRSASTREQV